MVKIHDFLLKTGINYQLALFLWLFCSMIFASTQADEIRLKKSRIAKKGLKLKIEVS